MTWDRESIELAFIRQFSVGGIQLSTLLSSADRRERIRVAILRDDFAKRAFYDSGFDYAAAYQLCFGEKIDKRRYPRENMPSHRMEELPDADDEDLEDF